MGEALVLNEAVFASELNGVLVQSYGIGVPTFDARELCRHQSVLVGERRWIVFSPLAQLFPMRRQEVAPPGLLVSITLLIESRHRQRGIIAVVEQLDLGGYGPKQRLRLVGCRERLGVLPPQEPRLQF